MRWWVAVSLTAALAAVTEAAAAGPGAPGGDARTAQAQMDNEASLTEEDKRAWSSLHGGWGKRGWQLLNTAWGKRAWRDMSPQLWGKRGWQDMSSAWGKRGWQDMSSAWGKRRWEDMNAAWGKRAPEKWSNFHGSWGKRSGPERDDYEDLADLILPALLQHRVQYGPADKRAWSGLHGAWGKRAAASPAPLYYEESTRDED